MKKYRILICLALVLSLLFLSACGSKQAAAAKGDQAAGKTGETAGTQASQAPTETNGTESSAVPEDHKNALPELTFNWKESYLRISPITNIIHIQKGKLLTYELLQDEIDQLEVLAQHSDKPVSTETIQKVSFTEGYFADNSLLLIGFEALGYWEITGISYFDGVLTCSATGSRNEAQQGQSGYANAVYYCFIEIDTVLPEETEIVVEVTNEFVSESVLSEKGKIFKEKLL